MKPGAGSLTSILMLIHEYQWLSTKISLPKYRNSQIEILNCLQEWCDYTNDDRILALEYNQITNRTNIFVYF